MEVFQAYLKEFKNCVSDYFGEDVLSDCFDGCKESQIVVLGKFLVGKSTLVNAILSEKRLEMSCFPEFPVIKLIRHDESSDSNITINYRNGDVEILSQQDYAEKFHIRRIGWDSACKLWQEVSCVELHSASNMISKNIAFVVMPALEVLKEDEVLPYANAIIFTLSAASLLSAKEREYIAKNFAGKK